MTPRRLLLAAALLLGLAGPARASLFVVVTSGDPMTQAVAMILSQQALQRQTPVRLLLCSEGTGIALGGYARAPLQPSGLTVQQMLQGLIRARATVEVCPIFFAKVPGAAPRADPRSTVTSPAAVGEFMARPEVRYFTF
jgi:hypothetical protein